MTKLFAMIALVPAAVAAWGQVDPNRVVAVVDGEEIKGDEYFRRMEYLPGAGKMLGNRFATFPPGFMTLEELINERLIFKLAKQKRCMPTEQEVQEALERVKAENPKLVEDWTASGRLMSDLLNQLKLERAQFRLKTNGITVTDQQVEAFYKDGKETLFTIPKRYRLRVISVGTDAEKAEVDKALAAGTPFADVAKKLSKDVTKVAGGEYGLIPVTGFQSPAKEALEKVKVGAATEWIQVQDGSVKFLLEAVVPAEVVPLDAKLKRNIREKMMLDKGAATNDLSKEMALLRKNSTIDIKNKQFAEAYKKFADSYIQQEGVKKTGGS